ncbi:hypothetical protein, partial [Flavivirga aquatica]|uniref:hypothetical protein n=1 Tax=Flavivirga aquatica TaxID=1849968 RepID=UPI0013F4C85C
DIKGGKKTSLKPVQLKKLVESFPNSASIWSLKNSIYNNTKDETVLSGNLTDEHKRIISDAFLLHEKEVREIPIVSKFIKSERLDAENGIMREIKCLKKLR